MYNTWLFVDVAILVFSYGAGWFWFTKVIQRRAPWFKSSFRGDDGLAFEFANLLAARYAWKIAVVVTGPIFVACMFVLPQAHSFWNILGVASTRPFSDAESILYGLVLIISSAVAYDLTREMYHEFPWLSKTYFGYAACQRYVGRIVSVSAIERGPSWKFVVQEHKNGDHQEFTVSNRHPAMEKSLRARFGQSTVVVYAMVVDGSLQCQHILF